MKQFPLETFSGSSADDCAGLLLEVVPPVMRAIREQMRGHGAMDLSVVQFRTLAFLNFHQGSALASIADHIGLTLPAASKIVNLLVSRRLLSRRVDARDRRKHVLVPTPGGVRILETARTATRKQLARLLEQSSPDQREVLASALRNLHPIFAVTGPAGDLASMTEKSPIPKPQK